MKMRNEVEELKLCDNAKSDALKYESKSSKNHAITKGVPHFPHNRFPSLYLHSLATDRLFHIWKLIIAQWSKSLDDLVKND